VLVSVPGVCLLWTGVSVHCLDEVSIAQFLLSITNTYIRRSHELLISRSGELEKYVPVHRFGSPAVPVRIEGIRLNMIVFQCGP
jgi:hypothetical protein